MWVSLVSAAFLIIVMCGSQRGRVVCTCQRPSLPSTTGPSVDAVIPGWMMTYLLHSFCRGRDLGLWVGTVQISGLNLYAEVWLLGSSFVLGKSRGEVGLAPSPLRKGRARSRRSRLVETWRAQVLNSCDITFRVAAERDFGTLLEQAKFSEKSAPPV